MKTILIIFAVLVSISAFIILFLSLYSGKAIWRILLNAGIGISLLIVINLTSEFTGVYIPVNKYSVIGTSVFSVPAIIGFLTLNLII